MTETKVRNRIWVLSAILVLALTSFEQVIGGKRVNAQDQVKKIALVVGVSKYQKDGLDDLKFAEKDASELAAELRKQQFEVVEILGSEATKQEIEEKFSKFIEECKKLGKKDVSLTFFSGHGVQRLVADKVKKVKKEIPFFCPHDCLISDPDTLVSLNEIVSQTAKFSGSSNNLLIIDACRNNPDKGARNFDGNLIQELPAKISILFSSTAGRKAYESEKLKHGVFTHVLLDGLRGSAQDGEGQVDWFRLVSHCMTEVPRTLRKNVDNPEASQRPNFAGNINASVVLATVKLSFYKNARLDVLKRHANSDIGAAQSELADRYYNGTDTEQDYVQARYWSKKARENGHDGGTNILALLSFYGLGVKEDKAEAIRLLKEAASRGFGGSQTNLGKIYSSGLGVEKDYSEALKWYRKAVEQNNTAAQEDLGFMYRDGRGVKQNYFEAASWFQKAAEQNSAKAQYELGVLYQDGKGVEKDYTKAAKWYRKAAEQNYSYAQYHLGRRYETGTGVEKDHTKAVKWYRKAAEQNNSSAQNKLGVLYEQGKLLERDYSEAVKWYRKAANQNLSIALKNLGSMYKNGWGVEKNYTEAVKLFRKAAEQNNAPGQRSLGILYANGTGVEKNIPKAVELFRKAANNGDELAKKWLKHLGY